MDCKLLVVDTARMERWEALWQPVEVDWTTFVAAVESHVKEKPFPPVELKSVVQPEWRFRAYSRCYKLTADQSRVSVAFSTCPISSVEFTLHRLRDVVSQTVGQSFRQIMARFTCPSDAHELAEVIQALCGLSRKCDFFRAFLEQQWRHTAHPSFVTLLDEIARKSSVDERVLETLLKVFRSIPLHDLLGAHDDITAPLAHISQWLGDPEGVCATAAVEISDRAIVCAGENISLLLEAITGGRILIERMLSPTLRTAMQEDVTTRAISKHIMILVAEAIRDSGVSRKSALGLLELTTGPQRQAALDVIQSHASKTFSPMLGTDRIGATDLFGLATAFENYIPPGTTGNATLTVAVGNGLADAFRLTSEAVASLWHARIADAFFAVTDSTRLVSPDRATLGHLAIFSSALDAIVSRIVDSLANQVLLGKHGVLSSATAIAELLQACRPASETHVEDNPLSPLMMLIHELTRASAPESIGSVLESDGHQLVMLSASVWHQRISRRHGGELQLSSSLMAPFGNVIERITIAYKKNFPSRSLTWHAVSGTVEVAVESSAHRVGLPFRCLPLYAVILTKGWCCLGTSLHADELAALVPAWNEHVVRTALHRLHQSKLLSNSGGVLTVHPEAGKRRIPDSELTTTSSKRHTELQTQSDVPPELQAWRQSVTEAQIVKQMKSLKRADMNELFGAVSGALRERFPLHIASFRRSCELLCTRNILQRSGSSELSYVA